MVQVQVEAGVVEFTDRQGDGLQELLQIRRLRGSEAVENRFGYQHGVAGMTVSRWLTDLFRVAGTEGQNCV